MSQIEKMISPKLALVICVRFLGIINKIIKKILTVNKLEMTQRVKKIKIINELFLFSIYLYVNLN